MSNPLATNAQLIPATGKKRYLRATKEGTPLDRQVPRTIQTYSGTGGEVIYDGSSDLVINAASLVATLFVRFGPAARNIRNLLNRQVNIHIMGITTREIILLSAPAVMTISSTNGSTNQYIIPADNTYKMISVTFVSQTLLSVDGGSWGALNALGIVPRFLSFTVVYPYGQATGVVTPSSFVLNTSTYNVTYSTPDPSDEGEVSPIITSVTGPGTEAVGFFWSPASRLVRPVEIQVNFTRPSGEFGGTTSVNVVPDLSNVFGVTEYITGPLPGSKNLGMYDTVMDPGTEQVMCQPGSGVIELPEEPLAVALDIQDNIFFYNTPSRPNIINWYSLSTYKTGTVCDLDTVGVNFWTTGAFVADIDYCESNSTLYILPGRASERLAMLPIKRYDYQFNGEVRTGPLRSIAGTGLSSTVQMSLAVDINTLDVFVANQPSASNIFITSYIASFSIIVSHSLNTGYASGTMSLTFSTRGDLIAQSSTDRLLLRVAQGQGITNGIVAVSGTYPLPVTFTSMSRNLYGCFPK